MSTSYEAEPTDGNYWKRTKRFCQRVWRNLTIEPAWFFITLADGIDSVSSEQLLLQKTCKNDFNYTDEICNNLSEDQYKDEYKNVQDEVADFNSNAIMVSSIFPIFLSFYYGAWADLFGRKTIMYVYVFSKFVDQLIVFLTACFMEWPKEVFIASVIPSALCGGKGIWMMCLYAFISDISHPDQRAFRMAMLFLASDLSSPLAPPIGAYLYETGGFVCVTGTATLGVALAAVSLVLMLRSYNWQPKKAYVGEALKRNLFHPRHVLDAIKTVFKKRPGQNRKFILILIASLMMQLSPFFGEGVIGYLYVKTRYKWDVVEYSWFNSITKAVSIAGQLTLIPLFKWIGIGDTVLLVGVLSVSVLKNILRGLAEETWLFYLAKCIDLIGHYPISITKAMVATCAPMEELGKIYSFQSTLDGILPLAIAPLYSNVWKATSETIPGIVYFISAIIMSGALFISVMMFCTLRGKTMAEVAAWEDGTGDKAADPDAKDSQEMAEDEEQQGGQYVSVPL